MKKRMFSVFICMALCLSLLPTTVLAGDTVSFIEYSWNKDTSTLTSARKSVSDYTTITNSTTNWNNTATGWYVAQGDVTIGSETVPQSVTVNGDVRLILADGCTLTVNGGIQVAEGNSLIIYGQSGGTGQLIANAASGSHNAGIGGNGSENSDGETAGTITIHGGQVTATGDGDVFEYSGAGIGGHAA